MTTKAVTIAGLAFDLSTPYIAGHVLTEAEAKQLNQVRTENVRNNTAAAVKKLATNPDSKTPEYTDEAKAAAAELVAKYDSEYEFSMSTAGPRKVTDPLEREALSIARAHVTATIKAAGKKVKDFDAEKLEAKIEALASNPEVIKLAKARLKEREKLSDALAIDLAGDETAPADEPAH